MKTVGKTDIGIYNPGGLRADLVSGPLTRGSLYEVFPFANDVVRFDVKGAQLVGLLLKNARAMAEGGHPVMQLAGVRATWRMRAGVPELVEARVGEKRLDPDSTYTASTNSFVAERWSFNLGFQPINLESLKVTVFEGAMQLAKDGPIVPPPNPRMVRLD